MDETVYDKLDLRDFLCLLEAKIFCAEFEVDRCYICMVNSDWVCMKINLKVIFLDMKFDVFRFIIIICVVYNVLIVYKKNITSEKNTYKC